MTKNIYIDGQSVEVFDNETILDVSKRIGIEIPTLCFLKNLNEPAQCRMCIVEVSNDTNNIGKIKPVSKGKLMTACTTKVYDNMIVFTHSNRVIKSRKKSLELLISMHDSDCLTCDKNQKCKLQKLCDTFNINKDIEKKFKKVKIDNSNNAIVRDNNKCILCGRCIEVCDKKMGCNAIGKMNRGIETYIGCANNESLEESNCVGCGQCTLVCPVGALSYKSDIERVKDYLKDENIITIAQVAPAVRVALGDEFSYKLGEFVEGEMVSSLKQLGFDYVYDINNGADFTVIEEGNELVAKIKDSGILNGSFKSDLNKNTFPLFTSCCPAWFNYVEKNYKDYLGNLSSAKSPNEILASVVKYYHKLNDNSKTYKIVSIMPCTAKKREIIARGTIDCSITTRELAKLLKEYGINLKTQQQKKFDTPFGEYSGGGLIFGTTGGVTEAALRFAIEKLTNQRVDKFDCVRYSDGVKEVNIEVGDKTLKLAIVHGLNNAKSLMENIISGKKTYHFVEVMACPGGCVNGGGQPLVDYDKISVNEVIKARSETLYKVDGTMSIRNSQSNKSVKDIYDNLLHNDKKLIHKLMHYREK